MSNRDAISRLEHAAGMAVSRETVEKIDTYIDLLTKWNRKINLVSQPSLQDVWSRHIVDSAQLLRLDLPVDGLWADVGAGAGLPGAVISILNANAGVQYRMHLIEADQRKAAFLQTVRRELSLDMEITNERVEALTDIPAAILSARAFAPLDRLLRTCERLITPETVCALPKGRQYKDELARAQKTWDFNVAVTPSMTDPEAAILRLGSISRAKT